MLDSDEIRYLVRLAKEDVGKKEQDVYPRWMDIHEGWQVIEELHNMLTELAEDSINVT